MNEREIIFKVTEKAKRPATEKDECTYCQQPIGGNHSTDCVLVMKKVKVRAITEYEIGVPYSWSKEDIEFHRNDSSWCADNMLTELDKLKECLCQYVRYEYIKDTSEAYLEEE